MSLLSHEDRQRVRAAVDEAKRAAIAAARNQVFEPWKDDEAYTGKLNPALIRARLAKGERPLDLAREFGVYPSRISDIKNGRRR